MTATANFSIYGTWLANESREPIPPYYTFCTSLQTPNCSRLETETHGWRLKPYLLVCLELHFVIQAGLQPMFCDVTQPMRNFHCSPTRTAFALTAESSKEGGQWISHSRPADLRPKDPRTHRSVNPCTHPPDQASTKLARRRMNQPTTPSHTRTFNRHVYNFRNDRRLFVSGLGAQLDV